MSAVCSRWNAVLSADIRDVAVFAALLPSQTVKKGLTRNFRTSIWQGIVERILLARLPGNFCLY